MTAAPPCFFGTGKPQLLGLLLGPLHRLEAFCRISRLACLPPLVEEVMTRFSLLVFLFALAMPLRPGDAAELWQTRPPTPAPVSGGHSGYADVNGIRLFHHEIGSSPPVVLLHGGLANSDISAIRRVRSRGPTA